MESSYELSCELSYEPSYESSYGLSYKLSYELSYKSSFKTCESSSESSFKMSCEPKLLHSRATVVDSTIMGHGLTETRLHETTILFNTAILLHPKM